MSTSRPASPDTDAAIVTARVAVLGKPIAHSLSPVIHQAGYLAAGLRGWCYQAIECDAPALPGLLAGLDSSWAGLSLTMPLKAAALAVADAAAPRAVTIGAANTLVRTPRGWYAENTDAPGLVSTLRAAGVDRAPVVAVLGAGGTARAALAAAADLAADEVRVLARRREAVRELAPVAAELGVRLSHVPFAEPERLDSVDVVVSTLPRGAGDALRVPWRTGMVFVDVVYDPWPTRLATAATSAGATVVSGLELLLAQAVLQFELFTGVPAPAPAMRQALLDAAGRR